MLSFEDFKKMELRIARIVEVKEHPDADRLYVIQVELEDQSKQIVAGIRTGYTAEDLVGKNIVVVNNLEPATIRGEESQGMLLAAGTENGPVILTTERDVPPGASVG